MANVYTAPKTRFIHRLRPAGRISEITGIRHGMTMIEAIPSNTPCEMPPKTVVPATMPDSLPG